MSKSKSISMTLKVKFPTLKEMKESGRSLKETKGAVIKGHLGATKEIERQLPLHLDRAMGSPVWAWPRVTQRRNGEIAGITRDLVDTGKLAASLKVKSQFLTNASKITISYSSPYAAIMYYGGIIQPYGNPHANAVTIPGRPWVEAVINGTHGIEKFDYMDIYRVEMQKAWDNMGG